jgi:hypothetical protein
MSIDTSSRNQPPEYSSKKNWLLKK